MPDAWKQLAGNPGRRPIDTAGPNFETGVPPCPDHLDGDARREWDRITPELLTAGLLCTVDMAALAMYCVAYSRWRLAEERIRFFATMDQAGAGLVQTTKNGFEQLSQWMIVSKMAQDQLFKYLAEFGLSPVARARVKHIAAQGDLFGNDPLAAFQRAAPKTAA